MDLNKYQTYALLKKEIKEMQQSVKELEKDIYKDIFAMDGEKLETPYATFSIMYRPKWKYSDHLTIQSKKVMEKLKMKKKEEEENGTAEKISDGGFLRCQVLKQ